MIASGESELLLRLLPVLVMAGAFLLALLAFRTKATPFDSLDALERKLDEGSPVVLEFFSNG